MTDIVERLRKPVKWASGYISPDPLLNEAADEIERLRAALLDALTLAGVWEDDHPIVQRARAALGTCTLEQQARDRREWSALGCPPMDDVEQKARQEPAGPAIGQQC